MIVWAQLEYPHDPSQREQDQANILLWIWNRGSNKERKESEDILEVWSIKTSSGHLELNSIPHLQLAEEWVDSETKV